MFCPARVYLHNKEKGHSIKPRPGQALVSVSSPNCISGGTLRFDIRMKYNSAGYWELRMKYLSKSTANIDVDFDRLWTVETDQGKVYKQEVEIDKNWEVGVRDVNQAILTVKTKPQSKGSVDVEFWNYSRKYATGNIFKLDCSLSSGYRAVELYFINGGGPCYILPLADGSDTELAALPEVIRTRCPDASLLVCADTDTSLAQLAIPRTKQEVYQALNPLLQKSPAYFLLADSPDGTVISGVERQQTAVYYPSLQITTDVNDEAIEVVGYWDSAVANLAQLKTLDPESYALIRQSVSPLHDASLCPSSAVAGAYCRNDRERGVWKAPANISLIGVRRLEALVSEEERGRLNEQGVNVIRWFSGKGPVIYGTRTLSDCDKWRYVPVRRLFNAAESDIKRILQPMVFEPNNSLTWARARAAVYNYLSALWRKGALAGNTEAEAFFVKIGEEETMRPEDVVAGKMIVQIGMAAVRPAEFIILQFSQSTS